jgi:hypothetical protein
VGDTPAAVGFLFGINAIFIALLLAGWRTRVVSVICWLFLISVQSRNGLILQGGDIVIRCLAFWAMFLPLGDYLSLDARKRFYPRLPGEDPSRPVRAFSWGTVAIIFQTACIYWFTALLKNDPSWWKNGYAIYLALNIDLLTKPLGRLLVNVPFFAYVLTFITIYMEAFGPFFAFFPLRNGPVRTATVFVFWIFHLVALQSMMYLGPFPFFCALAWLVFLPSWFWDTIAPWWKAGREQGIRRRLSRWAANYMPSRGESDLSGHRPVRLGLPLPANLLAAFYLFVICIWNIRTVNFGALVRYFPVSWNRVAELPHVDQCWDMFSPSSDVRGWLVCHIGQTARRIQGGPDAVARQLRGSAATLVGEAERGRATVPRRAMAQVLPEHVAERQPALPEVPRGIYCPYLESGSYGSEGTLHL